MQNQKPKRKNKLLVILPLILGIVTFLTGCVQYDVGVNFAGLHKGEIVQSIKLEERLKNFNPDTFDEWLNSIENRAKKLDGKVKRVSEQELIVTIPFNNGKDLQSKYNNFFNPVEEQKYQNLASQDENLPEFKSKLQLKQGNFLFWVRNHLIYDLDLRSLSLASNSNLKIDPSSLFQLEFSLKTPRVARSIIKSENAINPQIKAEGKQLTWELQPGELNHLEAVFWLPSPLGIGTFVVVLFILAGRFLKYQILTNPGKSKPPQVSQT
ncbi:DUF3153 domain-containing protein [Aerosakkonemataceae cyanobacterium BLCC-F154]|uniref:DUF3153 domain-containing protein n=1 Tax=Floridaenema fluviatile BLCC-F154 TaxID=3153640 RepID=A0ABV4YEG0_9CYAN